MQRRGAVAAVAALFGALALALAGCGGGEEEHEEPAHEEAPAPVAAPEGGVRITRVLGDTEQVFAALGRQCWAFELAGAPISYALRLECWQGDEATAKDKKVVYETDGDGIAGWIASVKAGGQPMESADGVLAVVLPRLPLGPDIPGDIETALVAGPYRRSARRPAAEVLPEAFQLPAGANTGDRLRYGVAGEGEVIVEEALMPGETVRLVDYTIKLAAPGAAQAHWLHLELTATCLEEGQLPGHREPLTAEELAERRKEREKEAAAKRAASHGGGHGGGGHGGGH